MPRTLVFDRTYPYGTRSPADPIRRPRVPVRVINPTDRARYIDLDMLVDSGADTTCLPIAVATVLGIASTSLEAANTTGVGGKQRTLLLRSGILSVCGVLIEPCPILFMPDIPELLLGRQRVFDLLCFGFE